MKILVTGMAGFIGFHVAKALMDEGHTVVGLDNLNDYYDVKLKIDRLKQLGFKNFNSYNEGFITNVKGNASFVKADIADKDSVLDIFNRHDFNAVCHLAAQAGVRYSLENPSAYIDSNITGFLNILEGCRHFNVSNLCFASSSSVYGLNKSQPFKTTDHTDHPVSLYAASKKSNEMIAHTYAHLFGIRATGLRFFTVYGPWGRPDMAPMLFAKAMTEGGSINVFNHGDMSRDFTYIDDIVKGIVAVLKKPASPSVNFDPSNPSPNFSSAPYAIYNIGNNEPVSLMEFINTLESAFNTTVAKNMMDIQPGDVKSTYADSQPLYDNFDVKPVIGLNEGIKEFAKWFKDYFKHEI